ncbi:MAG: hypothetical protein QG608_973 [Actinomycetota bacterium]|nr:hypothetical protein [Actinomycetota bacterium]
MSDRSDSELARAWGEGDVAAFAEVHARQAGHLLGLASILAVDQTVALDLLHDTFLHASAGIRRLKDPDRLRAWLFALLRATAHDRHGCRRPPDLTVLAERLPDHRNDPRSEPSPRELAEALWTAANGLDPTDRELLELYLLGNLEAGDLAAVLGIHPGNAAMLLFQLRERMERTIGALLIARLGRWDCQELDLTLQGWDGRFTRAIGTLVTRHVERCPDCARRRRSAFTLDRLSPALPGARAVPASARQRAVADFARRSPPPSQRLWRWRQDGFPDLRTTQTTSSLTGPAPAANSASLPGARAGTGSRAGKWVAGRSVAGGHCGWPRPWESRRYQALTALAGVLVLSSSAISLGALMASSQGAAPSFEIPQRSQAGSYPTRPWPSSVSRSTRGSPQKTVAPPQADPVFPSRGEPAAPLSPVGGPPSAPGSAGTVSTASAPGTAEAMPFPLTVSPGLISLGGSARTGSVHVLNPTGSPIPWTLTVNGTGLTAEPRTGVLEPGEGTRVRLEVNRALLPDGSMTGSLVFHSGGVTRTVAIEAFSLTAVTPVDGRATCRKNPGGSTAAPTTDPTCQRLPDLDAVPRFSRSSGSRGKLLTPYLTPSPEPGRPPSRSPSGLPGDELSGDAVLPAGAGSQPLGKPRTGQADGVAAGQATFGPEQFDGFGPEQLDETSPTNG